MPVPKLDDLKRHLNIPLGNVGDDSELSFMLSASLDVVSSIVGPLAPSAISEMHYGLASPALVLRQSPVVDLTAVRISRYGDAGYEYLASDLILDPEIGVVRLASGMYFRGDVTVAYSAGRPVVPDAVALATLLIAAQLWESQRGAMPLPANSGDDDYAANVGFSPAIPNHAKTLLEPFARGPVVA